MTQQAIEKNHAVAFLRALCRAIPDDERVMVDYPKDMADPRFWSEPWKEGAHIKTSRNCYVSIASAVKKLDEKTGKMRYGRGSRYFGHGLALMVDDIGTEGSSKGGTIDFFVSKLPPSAIVATSNGNHQLWWFLEKPESDQARFKGFIESFVSQVLAAHDIGDKSITDTTRLGRLPCGENNKRLPNGQLKYNISKVKNVEEAFRPKLVHFMPNHRLSIDQIISAFGVNLVIRRPALKRVFSDGKNREQYTLLSLAERVCQAMGLGENGRDVAAGPSGTFRIDCPWGHLHKSGRRDGAWFAGPGDGRYCDFVFSCSTETCRKRTLPNPVEGGSDIVIPAKNWAQFIDDIVMPHVANELEIANQQDWSFDELTNWSADHVH
jgi:hypothetical protein